MSIHMTEGHPRAQASRIPFCHSWATASVTHGLLTPLTSPATTFPLNFTLVPQQPSGRPLDISQHLQLVTFFAAYSCPLSSPLVVGNSSLPAEAKSYMSSLHLLPLTSPRPPEPDGS